MQASRRPIFFIAIFAMLMLGACSEPYHMQSEERSYRIEEVPLPYEPPGIQLAVPPAPAPVEARVVAHGSRRLRLIALTFDACSTAKPSQYDRHITKVLVDMKVPATIFLGGKWMEDQPEHTRYLASLPQFELGNHTYLHPHMTRVSDKRLHNELEWTQEVMYTLTGRQATLFRAPYGEYDSRVVHAAATLGMTTVQYDLASGDPDAHISEQRLIDYVSQMTRDGSIIVMHINGRGWHTADALPQIITRLRQRGFQFVTVSKLIDAASLRQHKS